MQTPVHKPPHSLYRRLRYKVGHVRRSVAYYSACMLGRDVYCARTLKCDSVLYGQGDGAWCVAKDRLSDRPTVLSFGVGTDISFDLDMHSKHAAEVHLFDPTPLSQQWISKRPLPSGMHFHPYGIADHDGHVKFELPVNHGVSFSMVSNGPAKQIAECEVKTFAAIVSELKLESVDVIKMDIEGAEYQVLPAILDSGIPVGQLLLEFHHRLMGPKGVQYTRQALSRLRDEGWRCFYRSPRALEFCFAK